MLGTPSRIASSIHALLGPTNTGKTHGCILRMLEHESGMLGLPLRLLAREVYDRVCQLAGSDAVALVTGEERRIPNAPRYWICTVEAMPISLEVEFLAIDEVQLMTHAHRGHVFTDRVLHARGTHETWFLGSASVRPLLAQLIPSAVFKSQPRLSRLTSVGSRSLGLLPPRSAIVTFSASGVYELAERVRARRGGAAVVLGALSPRTRNAQVALYQAGEVDYLVATDAIGMGLNMAINHVALAGLRKFDGKEMRDLSVSELAQVTGRAGRYLNDGTFGTLEPAPPLPHGLASDIENHRIPLEHRASFRSSALDFSSLAALQRSLQDKPRLPCLRLITTADDAVALELATRHARVRELATTGERIELLWQVCQIPDYRKLLPEIHNDLVVSIYEELTSRSGTLNEDWLAARITRLDDTSGDIDTLLGRISFVRTWTYVVNHRQWVTHSRYWRERTAQLEDALSDALHERLVQRFVERTRRSTSASHRADTATRKSIAQKPTSTASTPAATASDSRLPRAAFTKLWQLREQLATQVTPPPEAESDALLSAPVEAFVVSDTGQVHFGDRLVAHLVRGKTLLSPEFRLEAEFEAQQRPHLEKKLREVRKQLTHAFTSELTERSQDPPEVRGILYQLQQGLGTLRRSTVAELLDTLHPAALERLKTAGVVVGHAYVYQRALLRPAQLKLRLLLSLLYFGTDRVPRQLDASRVSMKRQSRWLAEPCLRVGYVCVGSRAVRCDALERALTLHSSLRDASRATNASAFAADDLRRLSCALGCQTQEVAPILDACWA